jgi:peptide-methionine (S)-S-oxide reductase
MSSIQRVILIVAVAVGIGYYWLRGGFNPPPSGASSEAVSQPAPATPTVAAETSPPDQPAPAVTQATPGRARAIFASGCFWCTEADFDKVPGVISTISGYIGGNVVNPTYEQVSSGRTGHAEAVEVEFDPAVVTYEALLDNFWHNVDPFTADRQFCDRGWQYRPVLFVVDAAQRAAAEASKARVQQRFSQPVVVEIVDAGPFYRAEEYHQDYYHKNSAQYRFYRFGCGRDARLRQIWQEGT